MGGWRVFEKKVYMIEYVMGEGRGGEGRQGFSFVETPNMSADKRGGGGGGGGEGGGNIL